ncbi:MAG: Asp-tRNA(Asn)/Glu-tRNA(Gln) amidotransferase subunit GatA [Planctomycetes bacterium]|nr:Asp-tRNA(Asn)/Glu-tRNA(Gln) amidotransferase subunit GatA [Planctomycetota bacterium]
MPATPTSPAWTRSARAIVAAVRSGSVRARAVADHYLARIERDDPLVHAFLHVDPAAVRAQADALDARIARGETAGALLGVPVAVKDNLCAVGSPTTCASKILEGYRPPYDATVVERLRAAGAIVLGKTNLDEFAMGASTENSGFGATRNPHDLKRVPGGSSGGSAAAVAAGFAPLALGSDTGGSVRQPAALCGVVGLRPTYGAVSRYGLVAFASSLDQVGPLALNVDDCTLLMEVIGGHDPRDSTSRAGAFGGPTAGDALAGLRIGIPAEYRSDALDPQVRAAVARVEQLAVAAGARLVPLELPLTQYAIPTYYLVVTSEASSNLARFDGVRYGPRGEGSDLSGMYGATRGGRFGDEVKRRIMLGTYALSAGYFDAYYKKALQVRECIGREFAAAFAQCDVLLGPTTPTPAFPLGEKSDDPVQMYLCDVFTAPAPLAGLPALSFPCGKTPTGLPIGAQLQGPCGSDGRLLAIARALERQLALDLSPLEAPRGA